MHLTHNCKVALEVLQVVVPIAISLASLATSRQANKRARKLEDQQDARHLEQLRRIDVTCTYHGAPAICVTNNSALDLADITLEQVDVVGDGAEGYTYLPNRYVSGQESEFPMHLSVLKSGSKHEFPLILCDAEGKRDDTIVLYGNVGARATISFHDELGNVWRKLGVEPPKRAGKSR